MPPVAGTAGAAAGTEDALVETVNEFTVLLGLVVLLSGVRLRVLALEEGFDHLVLRVKISHVHH